LEGEAELTLSAQLPLELKAHLKALWVASAPKGLEEEGDDSFDDLLASL
jgi:uncharacterized protein (DUF2267 family)